MSKKEKQKAKERRGRGRNKYSQFSKVEKEK